MATALVIRFAALALAFAAVVLLVMRPWFLGGRGGAKGNEVTSGNETGFGGSSASGGGTSGDGGAHH